MVARHSRKGRWAQVCLLAAQTLQGLAEMVSGSWYSSQQNKVQFSLYLLSNCICGEFQSMLRHYKSATFYLKNGRVGSVINRVCVCVCLTCVNIQRDTRKT